ncbi:MAG: glycosyltransferase family 4 protein [Arcobacter sp.]|nr:glycosyltransferase family 4 protein [Arcobacter sp.]
MNQKTLFILHYPPPVHGASMVGKFIKESQVINNTFNIRYIHLGVTKAFKERKKVTLRKVTYFFVLLLKCIRVNSSYKPKLIYMTLTSNGIGLYKDALIIFFLRLRKVQMVYHFHNKGIINRQDRYLDNIIYKYILKNAKIILLSDRLYFDVKKYVSHENVFVCPNGIPKLEHNLLKSKKQNAKDQPVEILFLSNLIQSKGVNTLLEACRLLLKKRADFKCIFVGGEGDISTKQFMNKVNALGLNNHVKYLGKKYGIDKDAVFRRADIFAFPTQYPNECFPLVLIEALQYSLPIVTTSEGGIEDIVEDTKNGYIVEKGNPTDLAQKLEALIESQPLRLEMGENGHKMFKENYTVDTFENTLCNIIKTIFDDDSKSKDKKVYS